MQVHFPFPTFPQQLLADALAEALDSGLVNAVGVCNYNVQQLQDLNGKLSKRGIPLASNQVPALKNIGPVFQRSDYHNIYVSVLLLA